MKKEFTLEIPKDTADYLQRLAYEVMTRRDVIVGMFEAHKDDADSTVLDSTPFKHYHKLLEEAEFAYDVAKNEFGKYLDPIVTEHEGHPVDHRWRVKDFNEQLVYISIEE